MWVYVCVLIVMVEGRDDCLFQLQNIVGYGMYILQIYIHRLANNG
jgi:hypothetical protein